MYAILADELNLIALLIIENLPHLFTGDFMASDDLLAPEMFVIILAPVSRAVLNDLLPALRALQLLLFSIALCILSHQFPLNIIHGEC